MKRGLPARSALWLGLLTAGLFVAAIPLAIAGHGPSQGIVVIPFGIVGYVVARRQPRNPTGGRR